MQNTVDFLTLSTAHLGRINAKYTESDFAPHGSHIGIFNQIRLCDCFWSATIQGQGHNYYRNVHIAEINLKEEFTYLNSEGSSEDLD